MIVRHFSQCLRNKVNSTNLIVWLTLNFKVQNILLQLLQPSTQLDLKFSKFFGQVDLHSNRQFFAFDPRLNKLFQTTVNVPLVFLYHPKNLQQLSRVTVGISLLVHVMPVGKLA